MCAMNPYTFVVDERDHFPFSDDDWSPAYNRTQCLNSSSNGALTFGVISLSGVQDDNLLERDSVRDDKTSTHKTCTKELHFKNLYT